MKNITDYKTIFWDFDGVILDSMPIRNKGFELVLKDYPPNEVNALLAYHKANGGLSRYVKFRYLYEVIKNEPITEIQVNELAEKFSLIMLENLIDPNLIINDSVNYIQQNYALKNMHIVSGSDGNELNIICKGLNLSKYFKTIQGSPTPKKQLVKDLIEQFYTQSRSEICLIGDSINDYEAAIANNIDFIGYNNPDLKKLEALYIESFI